MDNTVTKAVNDIYDNDRDNIRAIIKFSRFVRDHCPHCTPYEEEDENGDLQLICFDCNLADVTGSCICSDDVGIDEFSGDNAIQLLIDDNGRRKCLETIEQLDSCNLVFLKYENLDFVDWWNDVKKELKNESFDDITKTLESVFPDHKDIWNYDIIIMKAMKE